MAKGIIAQLVVAVTSQGAGKVRKETEELVNSTNRVGDAHANAGKSARDHFNTQEKGIIGTANSTRSFSKLAQTMNGGGSSSVVGAYATLMANVFALTAAFNALKSAAAMQQIEKGLEALGTRTGQTLSIAAKGLKEITGNAISTEQALRSSAQVFSAGFGREELERLGKVANDASFALGRNMTDSMDRLTRGVIKLEPELLDELGIMTRLGEATKAYALELNKSESALSTSERRQAFFNAVMAEGELKFGGLAEAAGNTKGFDQLAASLSDVTKQVMNLINHAALPLAAIFSTSPTALIGGAILFASTIKDQLLPGLADLSKRSTQAAEHLEKLAKREIKDIMGIDNSIAVLDDLQDKIKNNIASLNDYKKAQADVRSEQINFQKEVDNYESRKTNTKQQTQEYIENKRALTDLSESYTELQEVIVATERVQTQRSAASAIELAGNFKFRDSMEELRLAHAGYRKELIASQKGQQVTATGLTALRANAFAASIGIRALGAAFLNLIPIFGQIIFFGGLLIAGFKALESKETKALNAALKDLGTVVDSLRGKMENLQRINESNAPAALRAQQSVVLETTAMIELAESIEKVRIARENAAKNGRDLSFSLGNLFKSTERADLLGRAGIKGGEFQAWTKDAKELVSSFQALEEIDPKALQAVISGTKNWDTLSIAQKANVLSDEIVRLGKAFEIVRDEFTNLQTTQKAAADGLSAFIRSAAPSTPFDQATSGLQAYNNAIRESSVLADASNEFHQRFIDTITNVADPIKNLMSLDTARYIDDLKTINTLNQKDDRTAAEERMLRTAKARQATSKVTLDIMLQEQEAIQKGFETAQRATLLAQSQNALLQARLKANQANNALSAEGLRRQLEGENQSIRNNMTALRQTKLLLDQQSAHTKNKIEQIQLEVEQNKQIEERMKLLLAEGRLAQQQAVDLAKAEVQNYSQSDTRRGEAYRRQLAAEAALEAYDKRAKERLDEAGRNTKASENSIIQLRQQRANFENQILAANTELAALAMEIRSAENITAAVKEKQLEIDRAKLTTLTGIRQTLADTQQMEQRISILTAKGRVSALEELKLARQGTEQSRQQLTIAMDQERLRVKAAIETARTSGNDKKAQDDAVRVLEEMLYISELQYQADIKKINVNEELQELQAGIFDLHKEGLEWQQSSLQILEKQVSAESSLLVATNSRIRAEENLNRKKKGYGEKTAFGEQAEEIRAATEAYKIAVSEANIKKSLIDLEFALLEAQQIQLREELAMRRTILGSKNGDGRFDQHIAQLDRVFNTLGSVNFRGMAETSKRIIDEGVKAAQTNMRAAGISSAGVINSTAQDYRDLVKARAEASRAISAPAAAGAAPIIAEAVEDAIVEPLTASETRLTSSLDILTSKVDELIKALSPKEGQQATPETVAQYTAREIAAAMGKYIADKNPGMTAWQHPDLGDGRVARRSYDSAHHSGRAIDVYSKPGNGEWNDPVERQKYQTLETLAKSIGGSTLFGGDHKDHLHIAFQEGSIDMVKAVELLGDYLPKRIASAIAQESIPVVLEDIPVTAKRGETLSTAKAPEIEAIEAFMPDTVKLLDVTDSMMLLNSQAKELKAIFSELGPQGVVMTSAIEGISSFGATLRTALDTKNTAEDPHARFIAMGAAASSALATIQQMSRAAADAKIENIDREIAAEQRRDGKSAESVEKIQALERKKDAINRKAFETNKKLMMAQSIIATATGIAQSLTYGGPLGIAMAAMVGALGAAQLAIIASTSYQSTSAPAQQAAMPTTLTIGKQGDRVDLAKNNSNAGGEIGYLRGARGQGRSAADYAVIGSAYGGNLPRGYGNTGYLVGEHGPEIIKPEVPTTVVPANDNSNSAPVNATFNIHALDASGVQDILHAQRGFIIGSIREAANANGQGFLEDVNTNVYTKPNVGRL